MSRRPSRQYCYLVYGVRVTTNAPFDFPAARDGQHSLAAVEWVEGAGADVRSLAPAEEPSDSAFVCRSLADGTTCLRWPHLYEFWIAADGSRVASHPLDGCDRAVLRNFLFGQVLAIALVRQGIEPLHAAVLRVGDRAVGFLGDCTFGKSTLLAAFLQAGHRVLTDDMLILDRRGEEFVALPGSGRIKLMPDSARAFLDRSARGCRLLPEATKRSFPVGATLRQRTGLPLKPLFLLPTPEERARITSIDIRPVPRIMMVQELLKNTFTTQCLDRERVARQFAFAAQVASDVDGYQLRYPSGLRHLPTLRKAIVEHIERTAVADGAYQRTA